MFQNLCELHRATAEKLGGRIALRYKADGMYRNLSWSSYRTSVDHAASGLIQLGINPGDRVAIVAANSWKWLHADLAMLSAGAVTVPLHAGLTSSQIAYQLSHSGARMLFVGGPEQATALAEVIDELPDLETIITLAPVAQEFVIPTYSWEGLVQRGANLMAEHRPEIAKREAELTPESLATIIYTSGTTGNPKGVMLSHGNLLSNAAGVLALGDVDQHDILLSWLPYSHIYARTVDHYLSTMAGMTLVLAESVDTLVDNLREIQPTWLTSVPRFYEKIWSSIESLPDDVRTSTLHSIFGPRIRLLSSGGAPLPDQLCTAFAEAGLSLLQGYGLTESSPVISFNSLYAHRTGTVGKALPEVEVKIAEDGEILTRGPHVMLGYWNNPTATSETIRDGWLHTGDVGELDADGYLSITDRKKDLIVSSSGKNIAPSEIERLITGLHEIDQAVIAGDNRPYLTAILVPNFVWLEEAFPEARQQTEGEFLTDQMLHEYLAAKVAEVMQQVSAWEQVKRFYLL